MTAWSDTRRWPAATRVRRSIASVGSTSAATTASAAPATTRFALGAADRLAQRLDADRGVAPVLDGVERPVEGREEAESSTFTTISRPSAGPTTQASRRRAGAGRTRARAITMTPSSGSLTNARAVKRPGWSGATRAAHTSRKASSVSTTEMATRTGPCRGRAPAASRSGSGRHLAAGRRPVAPQPPDVAAERLGEQGERGGEGGAGEGQRQDAGCRDRQHDPLRRRDDLAPVAPGQRRAHPRDQPPGDEERVACRRRSRAPTRRPRARRRRRATRIRNASTSPSQRAPSVDSVPVRRATYPST